MNRRTIIRAEVFRVLDNAPGFALVQIGRRHKLDEMRSLPAAIIYTDGDEQVMIAAGPLTFRHEVELRVALYIKARGADRGERALDELQDLADGLILPALNALDALDYAIAVRWEVEGEGEAHADYLLGERLYQVVYTSSTPI